MNKSESYKALIQKVREKYKVRHTYGSITLTGIDDILGTDYMGINLYTYWQGIDFSDTTPNIKYMLVAQDWGSIAEIDNDFVKRIKAINNGKLNIPYINNCRQKEKGFPTDNNLIKLFCQLGYGVEGKESIAEKRYPELFFTNFCLGYRIGNSSGDMPQKLMMQDAELFHDLCVILEPENILCLGKLTFSCVYESLTGAKATRLKGFSSRYNHFIRNHDDILVQCNDSKIRLHPLAHCGKMGILNRNRLYTNGKWSTNSSLDNQLEDWRIVAQTSQKG